MKRHLWIAVMSAVVLTAGLGGPAQANSGARSTCAREFDTCTPVSCVTDLGCSQFCNFCDNKPQGTCCWADPQGHCIG
jgi:hypothetical protein